MLETAWAAEGKIGFTYYLPNNIAQIHKTSTRYFSIVDNFGRSCRVRTYEFEGLTFDGNGGVEEVSGLWKDSRSAFCTKRSGRIERAEIDVFTDSDISYSVIVFRFPRFDPDEILSVVIMVEYHHCHRIKC